MAEPVIGLRFSGVDGATLAAGALAAGALDRLGSRLDSLALVERLRASGDVPVEVIRDGEAGRRDIAAEQEMAGTRAACCAGWAAGLPRRVRVVRGVGRCRPTDLGNGKHRPNGPHEGY
ncbi:hypothetical protein Ait01nite_038530 [Actinoplanes italicus]|nr:hypothetical protein Ait01nite_038530 [Actinoplanes italicus]